MFKILFWNRQQRRLRALWRLAFQFGLMLILFLLASFLPFGGTEKLLKQTVPLGVAMLGSVWLAGRFLDRRRFADFGFRFGCDWWIDFCFLPGTFFRTACLAFRSADSNIRRASSPFSRSEARS
jgi:hypothetical protein